MRDRPVEAGAIGRSCAVPRGAGSDLGGRRAPPSPSLRLRVSYRPTTRAHVRLLGPCFKTGREGGRRDHGPRARPRPDPRAGSPTAAGTANSARRETSRPDGVGRGPPRRGERAASLPRTAAGTLRRRAVTPPSERGPPSRRESGRPRSGRGPRRSLVRWVGTRAAPPASRERPLERACSAPPRPTESEPTT